jgi:hypothetical protein
MRNSLFLKLLIIFAFACWFAFVKFFYIKPIPKELDPVPFIGCYSKQDLKIEIDRDRLHVNGKEFKYAIRPYKSGTFLESNFSVVMESGVIKVQDSELIKRSFTWGGKRHLIVNINNLGPIYLEQRSC